jgi:hypothetical protein
MEGVLNYVQDPHPRYIQFLTQVMEGVLNYVQDPHPRYMAL